MVKIIFSLLMFVNNGALFAITYGNKVTVGYPKEASERDAVGATVRLISNNGRATCSSTLISLKPPMLATARHCVQKGGKETIIEGLEFQGLAGEKIESPKIKKIHLNENDDRYDISAAKNPEYRGDYAIIELDNSVNLPATLKAVAVPDAAKEECPIVENGTKIMMAGYGANSFGLTRKPNSSLADLDQNTPVAGVSTLRIGFNEINKSTPSKKEGLLTYSYQIPPTKKATGINTEDGFDFRYQYKSTMESNTNLSPEKKEAFLNSPRMSGIGPGDSGGPLFVKKTDKYILAGITGSVERDANFRTINFEGIGADLCDEKVNKFFNEILGKAKPLPKMIPRGVGNATAAKPEGDSH